MRSLVAPIEIFPRPYGATGSRIDAGGHAAGPAVGMGSWLSDAIHSVLGRPKQPPSQADVNAELAKITAAQGPAVPPPNIGGVPIDQVILFGGLALATIIITHRRPS